METTSSAQSEPLLILLAQQVEDHRADLLNHYFGVLREALFSSNAEVRPNALKQIAADEVDAFLYFLEQSGTSSVKRGELLHQAGFKIGTILKLSQATRQFLLHGLENLQIATMLKIVDAYEMAIVEGFVQSIDKINKIERGQLERVLKALHPRDES